MGVQFSCPRRLEEMRRQLPFQETLRLSALEVTVSSADKRRILDKKYKLIDDYENNFSRSTATLGEVINEFERVEKQTEDIKSRLEELSDNIENQNLDQQLKSIEELDELSEKLIKLRDYKKGSYKKNVYKKIDELNKAYEEFVEQKVLHDFYNQFSSDGAHIRGFLFSLKEGEEGYAMYIRGGGDNYAKKIIDEGIEKFKRSNEDYKQTVNRIELINKFCGNFHTEYSCLEKSVLNKQDTIYGKLDRRLQSAKLELKDAKECEQYPVTEEPELEKLSTKKEKIKTRKEALFKEQIVIDYRLNSKQKAESGSEIFVMNNPKFPLVTLFTIHPSLDSKLNEGSGLILKERMLKNSAMRSNVGGNGFVHCSYHPNQDGGHHKIKFKDSSMDLRFYGTGKVIKIDENSKEEIESRISRDKEGVNLQIGQYVMIVSMNAQATHDQKQAKNAMGRV